MNKNNKIKDLMEKQRQDDRRGTTYGSGVALESDTIPEFIKQVKIKKKELLCIHCPFLVTFKRDTGQQEQINISIMA